MPRQARLDARGIVHHAMARGVGRRKIYKDSNDYEDFIQRLSMIAANDYFQVYAWALMPNHFHLLVRTRKRPLTLTFHPFTLSPKII